MGCQSEPNITVYKIEKNKSLINKISKKNESAQLRWVTPNNWVSKEAKDFRIASFNAPSTIGEIMDISVSIFPGDAGGIKQNVNRWRSQLNLPPQDINLILQHATKKSNMLGEYFIFNLTNKTEQKSILAVIIPDKEKTIFVKMPGSSLSVSELEYEFDLFCKSLHWNN